MPYCAAADLAVRPGAKEIAQVATPAELRAVEAELMRLSLVGADRAGYSAEAIAAADAAMARVNDAIAEADETIDGYLRARYPLPLSPVPEVLRHTARNLIRYALHQHLTRDEQDPIVRAYRDAIRLLESIGAGRVTLGARDPSPAQQSGGSVQTGSMTGGSFSDQALQGFMGRLL